MKRWGDWTVSQILPHRCISCSETVSGPGFCTLCWSELKFITPPLCVQCGDPFELPVAPGSHCGACTAAPPLWRSARAIWRYTDASKRPILGFKYQDRTALAQIVVPMLRRAGQDLLSQPEALLVPVPLHWSRLAWRSYNQAALLGDALRAATGIALDKHALRRVRRTPRQQGLDRLARQANVGKAFIVAEAARPRVAGKAVILLDDVVTTGATAAACTRALLQAGATSVDVLALARVVQPRALPI